MFPIGKVQLPWLCFALVAVMAITSIAGAGQGAADARTTSFAVIGPSNSTTLAGYVDIGNYSELNHHYAPERVAEVIGLQIVSPSKCLNKHGSASFWTGIGGWDNTTKSFDSSNAVKVGVTITCVTVVKYQEWYDFGAAKRHIWATQVYNSTHPSVSISGMVQYNNSTGTFHTFLYVTVQATGTSQGYYFNQTDPSIVRNSIEWLLEDRGTALPDFKKDLDTAWGVFGNATNNTAEQSNAPCYDGDGYSIGANIGCIVQFENVYKYNMVSSSAVLMACAQLPPSGEKILLLFRWASYGP